MRSYSSQPPPGGLAKHLLDVARHDEEGVARYEDSTMFSLDKLMEDAAPTARSSGFASDDDSGVIDLKALGAGLSPDENSMPHDPWVAGGAFPLGAPTPPPSVAAVATPHAAPGKVSRASHWLMGALAGTALVLAAAIVFLLVSRPAGHAPVLASSSTTGIESLAAALATGSTTAARDAWATFTVPGATTDSAEAALSAAETSSARPTGRERPRPQHNAAAPAASPPPPAAAPRSTECRCPPDDLLCHMHCRQGR